MKSLLESVACAYLDNETTDMLADCCFVFPNKRTGVYFHHIMARAMRQRGLAGLQAASMTITDFVEEFAEGTHADRLESIFILYGAYRDVALRRYAQKDVDSAKNADIDFNKFQRWADVLMGDFNDVDMSLVDTHELFPNLESLREISANYLSDRQIEAIRRHWSEEKVPQEVSAFWNHMAHSLSAGARKPGVEFIKLWQVMQDVYDEFNNRLKARGLHYMGMAYREVAYSLRDIAAGDLPYRRFVFVGFSMLTPAERKIFATLRDKYSPDGVAVADFYWDNASPAFRFPGNTGAFINRIAKEFPSLYDCVRPIEEFPKISIIGVPSRVGQAKLAGEIIEKIYPGMIPPSASADEAADILRATAVVFPDESLAIPTLRSIPADVSPINITMGYKLRPSSAASFVSAVIGMQIRGRISASGGEARFISEDVLRVLSHPIMHQGAPREAIGLTLEIRLRRSFNQPLSIFKKEEYAAIEPVFRFVRSSDDPEAVLEYLSGLLDWTVNALRMPESQTHEDGPVDGDNYDKALEEDDIFDIDGTPVEADKESGPQVVDLAIARRYSEAIEHLRALSKEYLSKDKIFLSDCTVFQLVERLVVGETLSFKGQPLRGLQLMGVLEARALDFENLIIPSLNEKIFPRRHYQKSLIPPVLRHAYGMLTTEHHEALYSYYFYRLISRARRVWLLYDARRGGPNGGGQMSRYLHQLQRLYRPAELTRTLHGYPVCAPSPHMVSVHKTPEIMAHITRYFSPENPLYLSASSINEYINCPLCFYIKNIEGYKREDDISDWISESTYGTVMHQVLQDIYDAMAASNPGKMITSDAIDSVLGTPRLIEQPIVKAINRHHLHLGEGVPTPLRGGNLIVGQLIEQYIREILLREKEITPFQYKGGEISMKEMITLREIDSETSTVKKELTFNLTATIDRVDVTAHPADASERLLRIVDYKTGADPTEASTVRSFFEFPASQREGRPKAMLQLFLYSMALSKHWNTDRPIQPLIYNLRQVSTRSFMPLKIEKKPVYDFHEHLDEVSRHLIPVLEELADETVPFRAASDSRACHYCKFIDICRKKADR